MISWNQSLRFSLRQSPLLVQNKKLFVFIFVTLNFSMQNGAYLFDTTSIGKATICQASIRQPSVGQVYKGGVNWSSSKRMRQFVKKWIQTSIRQAFFRLGPCLGRKWVLLDFTQKAMVVIIENVFSRAAAFILFGCNWNGFSTRQNVDTQTRWNG